MNLTIEELLEKVQYLEKYRLALEEELILRHIYTNELMENPQKAINEISRWDHNVEIFFKNNPPKPSPDYEDSEKLGF